MTQNHHSIQIKLFSEKFLRFSRPRIYILLILSALVSSTNRSNVAEAVVGDRTESLMANPDDREHLSTAKANETNIGFGRSVSLFCDSFVNELDLEYQHIGKQLLEIRESDSLGDDKAIRELMNQRALELYRNFREEKIEKDCISILNDPLYKEQDLELRLKYENLINDAITYYIYYLGKNGNFYGSGSTSDILEKIINANIVDYMDSKSKGSFYQALGFGFASIKNSSMVIKNYDLSYANFIEHIQPDNPPEISEYTRYMGFKLSAINQICFELDDIYLNEGQNSNRFLEKIRQYDISLGTLTNDYESVLADLDIYDQPDSIFLTFDRLYNNPNNTQGIKERNYVLISKTRHEFYKTQYRYFIGIQNKTHSDLEQVLKDCSKIEELSRYFEKQGIDMVDIFSYVYFLRAKIHYELGDMENGSHFMAQARKWSRQDLDLFIDLSTHEIIFNHRHGITNSKELENLAPLLFIKKYEQASGQGKTMAAYTQKIEQQKQELEITLQELQQSRRLIGALAGIMLALALATGRAAKYLYKKLEDKAPSKEYFRKIYINLIIHNFISKIPIIKHYKKNELIYTLYNQIAGSFDISGSSEMSFKDFYSKIKDEFIELMRTSGILVLKNKEGDDFDIIYQSNFNEDKDLHYIQQIHNNGNNTKYLRNKMKDFMYSFAQLVAIKIPHFNTQNINTNNNTRPGFYFKGDVAIGKIVFQYSEKGDNHNAQDIFVPASRGPKPSALARNGFVFRFKKTRNEYTMYLEFLNFIQSEHSDVEIEVITDREYRNTVAKKSTTMNAIQFYIYPKLITSTISTHNSPILKIKGTNKQTGEEIDKNTSNNHEFDEDQVEQYSEGEQDIGYNWKMSKLRKDKQGNCYYCELDHYESVDLNSPTQYILCKRQENGQQDRHEGYMRGVIDTISGDGDTKKVMRFSYITPELEKYLSTI